MVGPQVFVHSKPIAMQDTVANIKKALAAGGLSYCTVTTGGGTLSTVFGLDKWSTYMVRGEDVESGEGEGLSTQEFKYVNWYPGKSSDKVHQCSGRYVTVKVCGG